MKDRIKQIRKDSKETQQEFADNLGISKNNIVNYEIGRRNPSTAVVQLICEKYKVNETWLLTGEGDMKAPPSREQEIADMVSKLVKLDPNDEADQLMYDTLMHLKDVPKSVWEDFLQFIKEEIPKLNLK